MLIYNIEEIYTTSKNVEKRYEKTNPTLSDGASAKVVSNFGTT